MKGELLAEVAKRTGAHLSVDKLVIGFARRAAAYKRVDLILGDDPAPLRSLRCVQVGGETCPADLALRHQRLLPDCAFENNYGPTEATIWSTTNVLVPGLPIAAGNVPIGRAIPGVHTYVLGASLHPVVAGQPTCQAADSFGATFVEVGASYGFPVALRALLSLKMVGGFTDPQGSRVGLGALLVGYFDRDDFVFAGKIGTGFDTKLLLDLRARLDKLEIPKSPFTKAKGLPRIREHWVMPEIVVQVAFIEWTVHGKLRHPRLLGVRYDKSPREVVREKW